jgi:hypothetical protein
MGFDVQLQMWDCTPEVPVISAICRVNLLFDAATGGKVPPQAV